MECLDVRRFLLLVQAPTPPPPQLCVLCFVLLEWSGKRAEGHVWRSEVLFYTEFFKML